MIDGSVLQSVQRCFEKKSRVVVKTVVKEFRVILEPKCPNSQIVSYLCQPYFVPRKTQCFTEIAIQLSEINLSTT